MKRLRIILAVVDSAGGRVPGMTGVRACVAGGAWTWGRRGCSWRLKPRGCGAGPLATESVGDLTPIVGFVLAAALYALLFRRIRPATPTEPHTPEHQAPV